MKKNHIKIIVVSLVIATFTGCSFTSQNGSPDKTGKEYTSAYICPMHCDGSGSDTMGHCPVCGMEYVKNTEAHK